MPRSLPPEAQAGHRTTHTWSRDREVRLLPEILRHQRSGPHGRAGAEVAWVPLDHRHAQRVNNPMRRAGTTTACPRSHARRDLSGLAAVELGDPLVDHLATEAQPIRHLWHRVTLVQPQ